jgi:hypothetical protein
MMHYQMHMSYGTEGEIIRGWSDKNMGSDPGIFFSSIPVCLEVGDGKPQKAWVSIVSCMTVKLRIS